MGYEITSNPISEIFAKAADAASTEQVVLLFPSLQEELQYADKEEQAQQARKTKEHEENVKVQSIATERETEREKLKNDWLNLLFTDQSVAALDPEGPFDTIATGNDSNPRNVVVWIGDDANDFSLLKGLFRTHNKCLFVNCKWMECGAAESLVELNLSSPEVCDATWYLRDRASLMNEDLDLLHDCEILGRSFVETVEPKIYEHGLDWKNVVVVGFGKGAGIALYASVLKLIPKVMAGMILFSPVIMFPQFISEKVTIQREKTPMQMWTVWGNNDRSTPASYRQLVGQTLRKVPEVRNTPDVLPEGAHRFDSKSLAVLTSLLPLCLPR